jgi:cobaltochelatase CobN
MSIHRAGWRGHYAAEIMGEIWPRGPIRKWIAVSVMRHGYKGRSRSRPRSIIALYFPLASTDAVANHHFDQLFAAYLKTSGWISCKSQSGALRETAARSAGSDPARVGRRAQLRRRI